MNIDIKSGFLSRESRGKIISILTCTFGLLYHLVFLFIFRYLGVDQMFLFNVLSVSIFSLSLMWVCKNNTIVIPYVVCTFEVIIHQILAEHYIGAESSFRFFILIMGILPFLVLYDKFIFSLAVAVFTSCCFSYLQITSYKVTGVYQIDKEIISLIKITNISLSILIIFFVITLFTYLMNKFEFQLEDKVSDQSAKIISLQNNTIISLSNLVENRDSDTGDHIIRTSSYIKVLAKKAMEEGLFQNQLNEEFIALLEKAAPMHDIGKIVVPDSILKKPGKLTPEEFEIMKRHTTEGSRIVHDVLGSGEDKKYIQMAADVAHYHHEKWDGSGYPENLKGEQIPLSARFMAIADVFDALVSPRCYKEPIPIDDAFEIIREGIGSHFDPQLANIFLTLKDPITEITAIFNK
ncbi:MAG: HD domain-containing protein [Treponema sp.]|nr:HD domain-containing protein [Treponema sp.]